MKIEEVETNDVKIKATKQTIDNKLDVPPPFMDKCGVYVISGAMGSGKSSFVNSIMTSSGKGKVFKKVFDAVHYATPKEVMESEENHPFLKHNPQHIYHDLTQDTFDKILEDCLAVKKEGGNSCFLIDDFSEELKNKQVQQNLKKLIYKHRHYKINIIITLLTLKSLPKQFRSLVDCYIMFRPKSLIEVASFSEDVFSLEKKELKALFEFVFDAPYNHLFYNQRTNTYYKNFNRLKLTEEE